MRGAYSDAYKAKGGAAARLVLDLPQELIAGLERRAAKIGKSILNFVRKELAFRYLLRMPERKRRDISGRPEVRRAIQLQVEMRRRHEGSGYSGSAVVHEMRDRK